MLFALLLCATPADIERQISEMPDQSELVRGGSRVAWTEGRAGADRVENRSAVWAAASDGKSPPVRVTARADDGRERAPAFSPDGKTLAFISDADGKAAIYLFDFASGKAKRLASPAGGMSDLHFSKSGTHIAFLGSDNADFVGASEALPADRYEVSDNESPQRLAQIDVATGAWHWLTPPDMFVYAFDEAPDETHWVVTEARGSGMGN